MATFEKHIVLLEAVNNAKNQHEYDMAYQRLRGFRDALECLAINHLVECDWHYIDQGIDRPMCCGVWLDWQPSA